MRCAREASKTVVLADPFDGGAIGLRALYNALPVKAAAFSAPMWGIRIHPALRPVAWALSSVGRTFGRGHLYAPGTSPKTYVAEAPFADNVLTTDATMYAFMQRQVTQHPDLALGRAVAALAELGTCSNALTFSANRHQRYRVTPRWAHLSASSIRVRSVTGWRAGPVEHLI
jgi:alpha-beta hydrolase superfamily lysophospholipase